jgi:hypothetical protein
VIQIKGITRRAIGQFALFAKILYPLINMADTLIENIMLREPHSPTATIIPDKHTIIHTLPEASGNHAVLPDPLNVFGHFRQKVGAKRGRDNRHTMSRRSAFH